MLTALTGSDWRVITGMLHPVIGLHVPQLPQHRRGSSSTFRGFVPRHRRGTPTAAWRPADWEIPENPLARPRQGRRVGDPEKRHDLSPRIGAMPALALRSTGVEVMFRQRALDLYRHLKTKQQESDEIALVPRGETSRKALREEGRLPESRAAVPFRRASGRYVPTALQRLLMVAEHRSDRAERGDLQPDAAFEEPPASLPAGARPHRRRACADPIARCAGRGDQPVRHAPDAAIGEPGNPGVAQDVSGPATCMASSPRRASSRRTGKHCNERRTSPPIEVPDAR